MATPTQKQLPPVPVRTPLLGPGGIIAAPWTQFLNALRAAAAEFPADTPAPSTTASDLSVPVIINGVTYWLRLSSTP
jgi:hypothetical protein